MFQSLFLVLCSPPCLVSPQDFEVSVPVPSIDYSHFGSVFAIFRRKLSDLVFYKFPFQSSICDILKFPQALSSLLC